jgi:aminopeptidase N
MKWWNDLWLNESFATVLSYISYGMSDETVATNAWLQFVEETRWAYEDDMVPSTHSIEAPCDTTDVAQGLIDGITYGKGAALLRQIIQYVGKDNFFKGCQSYFQKFAWSNTTLSDFFGCLQSQVGEGKDSGVNLHRFSESWLKTKGCNTYQLVVQ